MARPTRRHDRRARRGAVRALGRRDGATRSSATCAPTASSCSAATRSSPSRSATGTIALGLTDNDDVAAVQRERREDRSRSCPTRTTIGTLTIPTTVGLVAGAKHAGRREEADRLPAVAEVEQKLIERSSPAGRVRDVGAGKVKAMDVDYARSAKQMPARRPRRRPRSSKGASDRTSHAGPRQAACADRGRSHERSTDARDGRDASPAGAGRSLPALARRHPLLRAAARVDRSGRSSRNPHVLAEAQSRRVSRCACSAARCSTTASPRSSRRCSRFPPRSCSAAGAGVVAKLLWFVLPVSLLLPSSRTRTAGRSSCGC